MQFQPIAPLKHPQGLTICLIFQNLLIFFFQNVVNVAREKTINLLWNAHFTVQ